MKKIILIVTMITILIMGSVIPAYADNIDIEAKTAILIDRATGEILYEKNKDQQMFPASTTKIITAILALENSVLEDIVTIDQETPFIEGSKIFLIENEEITIEQLLYALLVESANDAADALAKYMSGTTEDFAILMNEKAKELGAVNTNFENPHGLPNDSHLTTAYDLAMIANYAMDNDTFRKIVQAEWYIIQPTNEQPEQRPLKNRNRLMWDRTANIPSEGQYIAPYYEFATGVKTGYTPEAGYCLVASAKYGNREVLAVVMKSQPNIVFADSKKLLDYGLFSFGNKEVVKKDGAIETVSVIGGKEKNVNLIANDNLTVTIKNDVNIDTVEKQIVVKEEINAPLEKGETLGTISAIIDGRQVASVALVAEIGIEKSMLAKLLFGMMTFWSKYMIPVIVVGGIVIAYLLLSLHLSIQRKKRRRRRRNRYSSTSDFINKTIIK